MATTRALRQILLISIAILGIVCLSGCGGSPTTRLGNVELIFVDAANPEAGPLSLTGQVTLAEQSIKVTDAGRVTFTGVVYGTYTPGCSIAGYQARSMRVKVDRSQVRAELVLVPDNDVSGPNIQTQRTINADYSTAPLSSGVEVWRLSGFELVFSEFIEPIEPTGDVVQITSSTGAVQVLGPDDWLINRNKLTLSPSVSWDTGAQSFSPRWEPGVAYTVAITNLVDYSGNPFPEYHFTIVGSPDTTQPAECAGLSGRSTDVGQQVMIQWDSSSEPDLWGYQLFRRDQDHDEYKLVSAKLLQDTTYLDDGLTNGFIYEYFPRAVDLNGNLGSAATPVAVTPASVNRGLIAFASDRQSLIDSDADFDLYVKFVSAAATQEAVQIEGLAPLGANSNEDCPAWAPDGRRLAYTSTYNAANPELYIADVSVVHNSSDTVFSANATSRQITANADTEASPTWSPDGKKLAYIRFSGSDGDTTESSLMVVDARAGSFSEQVVNNGRRIEEPDWRPQGDKIVYCTEDEVAEFWQIEVVDLASQARSVITPKIDPSLTGDDRDPAFSPDGSRIAFSSTRGYVDAYYLRANIWVMDLDGSNAFQVSIDTTVTDSSPVWSPDGSELIFTRETDSGPAALYRVAARPGAVPQLLEATPAQTIPFMPAAKNWLPTCAK